MNRYIIGVSGHRKIQPDNVSLVQTNAREILSNIPYNSIVLCGLANGVDLLVAEVCLKMDIPYQVIFPFPKEQFKQESILADFKDKEEQQKAKSRFEYLLSRAREIIIPDEIKEAPADNGLKYRALGRYIVEHSNLMLIFWNGIDNGKPGGTADVVRMAKRGEFNANYRKNIIIYLNNN